MPREFRHQCPLHGLLPHFASTGRRFQNPIPSPDSAKKSPSSTRIRGHTCSPTAVRQFTLRIFEPTWRRGAFCWDVSHATSMISETLVPQRPTLLHNNGCQCCARLGHVTSGGQPRWDVPSWRFHESLQLGVKGAPTVEEASGDGTAVGQTLYP